MNPFPKMVISDQRFRESRQAIPSSQTAVPPRSEARTRLKPRFSTSQATMGSSSEIAEVQAANTSSRKNRAPNTRPPGIWPKAIGKTLKTMPEPSWGVR